MPAIEQIPQLPGRVAKSWRHYIRESLLACAGALAITWLIDSFHLYPMIPNISIIYLLIILVLAGVYGRYAAILASLIAVLSFDFFLVPPVFSLLMNRWEEWLALVVFLLIALFASQLAVSARANLEQAQLRERESWILYEVGQVLNSTSRLDEQLESIALALVRIFAPWGVRACALLLPDDNDQLSVQADAPMQIEPFALTPAEMAAAREVMTRGKGREVRDNQVDAVHEKEPERLYLLPLKTATLTLGVLCLRIQAGVEWFASEQIMAETLRKPRDQAIFFRTFLNEAVMKIEQTRLCSPGNPNTSQSS